jgi:hypothetical protein
VGIAALLIGGAWVLPMKENERLDVEVKKRSIIRDHLDAEMKKRAMIRDDAAKMVQ